MSQITSIIIVLVLSIIVVLSIVTMAVSGDVEKCADGTQRYPNKTCNLKDQNCPNTYRCRKKKKNAPKVNGKKIGECCRYKQYRDCDALMSNVYTPNKCQGGGSIRCPGTHKCFKGPANIFSMCCPMNRRCTDEAGVEHKPADKPWKSHYDNCNKCECGKDGKITCTNKQKCSMCRVDGKKLSRGDFYWKDCKRCKCISNKRSVCEGPCESGTMGMQSTFSPRSTINGGCNHQVKVSQCYHGEKGQQCADTIEHKLEFKESEEHDDACPKPGLSITESGSIITSGKEVNPPNKYRWMVYLNISNKPICGGTILSRRHILTAAHCVVNAREIMAQTGKHNVTVDEPRQQNRNDCAVHIHEDYNASTYNNDIAILVVDPPLEFNNVTQPIHLAESHFKDNTMNILCRVIGWGKFSDEHLTEVEIRFFAKNSDVLREAVLTNLTCDLPSSDLIRITKHNDTMFCASNFKGNKKKTQDACFGDSGGPLMCRQGDKRWTQYGIVSWGPDIYGETQCGRSS
ncbi:unnamed protein product, partial [Owenia fusiformis]